MNLPKHVLSGTIILSSLVLLLALPINAQNMGDVTTVNPIFNWTGDNSAIEGAEAILTRMEHGIAVSFETTGLVPGEVYTAWWVIFNSPENCSPPDCLMNDLFMMDGEEFILNDEGVRQANRTGRQLADISQIRATSSIADENGYALFRAHLPIGDLTDFVSFGNGLVDSMNSEVHVVIRTHGPAADDLEIYWEQQMTEWGGCPDPVDRLPCKNVQFAAFMPAG